MAVSKKMEVFKCALCGNIVEVLHAGGGELVCCGKPMDLLEEQTADSSVEKHVPVIVAVDGGVKVKVGSVPHPMTEEHSIQWVSVQTPDGGQLRHFFKPGDEPEAEFGVPADGLTAREYCNRHGLWKSWRRH